MQQSRSAKHAGSWYSNNQNELDDQLKFYLNNAQTVQKQRVLKALIGPHAGFVFSGPNAAWAYKAVDPNAYDRVFILGPSHKVFLDFMATTACSQWETPIGSLKVDLELVGQLCQQKGPKIQQIDKKHEENEHSLEMHLPYIRKMFESRAGQQNDIQIVPLMVGQINNNELLSYAQVLEPYFQNDRNLFVISSDFCHWGQDFEFQHKYPNYKDSEISQSIQQLDHEALTLIENQNLSGFQNYLATTKNTICGSFPIEVLLGVLQVSNVQCEAKFVKYDQSGPIKRMSDTQVSYASALVYKKS